VKILDHDAGFGWHGVELRLPVGRPVLRGFGGIGGRSVARGGLLFAGFRFAGFGGLLAIDGLALSPGRRRFAGLGLLCKSVGG